MKSLQLIPAVLFTCVLTAAAQTTFLWTNIVNGNASGSWGTAAAWNPAGPATGQGNTAQFTLPLTNAAAPGTVTLDGNRTIGNLLFGNTSASNLSWTVNTGSVANANVTLNVASGTPTITVTNQGVTFSAPLISPTLGFIKNGGGSLTLNNTNNFGTVSNAVVAGSVALNLLTALPAGSVIGVSSGATLNAPTAGTYNNNAVAIAGGGNGGSGSGALRFGSGGNTAVTWPGQITLVTNATISSYGVTYNTTLSAPIVGTGNLTFNPQGGNQASHTSVFNLNSQSTYAGNTTFGQSGGLLNATWNYGTNNALPPVTALTVSSGASANTFVTLNFSGYSQSYTSLTLNAGLTTVTEGITNSSATIPTITLNGATAPIFVVKQGTNNLNNFNLNVGNAGNSPAGSEIGAGGATVLNVNNVTWNSSFYTDFGYSSATVVNLNNGATLNNAGEILMGYSGAGSVNTLNVNTGAVVNAHYIRVGNQGASTLNLNSGATVTADEIYNDGPSNSVSLNGVLLQPNTAPYLPWLGASLTNVQVQAGGANINTAGKTLVVAAALLAGNPSGGLNLTGTGTLVLSNANNTYTGATTVSNGTLAVDGNLPASPVTLAAVAGATPTLAGYGYVANATINNGTYVNPGRTNSVGTLTISNLVSSTGSVLAFDLSSSDPIIDPTINDLLVTTNVSFAAGSHLAANFLGGYPVNPNRYVVATYSGAATGLENLDVAPQLIGSRAAIGVDVATVGQIALVVTNGTGPSSLTWYGQDNLGNLNSTWDLSATTDWNSANDVFYNQDVVTFDDSAQTNLVTLATSLYPGSVTFNNNSLPYTLSGPGKIGGAAGLTVNGSAGLTVTADNDFSGGVLLAGSPLAVQIGNGGAAGSLGAGNIQVSGSAVSLLYNRSDAQIWNNRIYGSSSALPEIIVNSGALTLGGAADNSYLGAVVTNGATLILGKASSSGIHSLGEPLVLYAGATVQLAGTGGDQIINSQNVTNFGGTFDLGGMNETIGQFNGYGFITNSGSAATLTLGGSANTSGALYANGGTLTLAGGTVTVAGTWNNSFGVAGGAAFNQTGGVLNSGSYFAVGNGYGSGTASMTVSGGSFNSTAEFLVGFTRPANFTLSGTGANMNLLYFSFGDGTINYTTNWFDGGTNLLTRFNDRGGSPATFYFNGTTFRAAGTQNPWFGGTATASNNVTTFVSTNGLIFDSQSYTVTENEPLQHDPALGLLSDGGLNKAAGSGTLLLQGAHTYTGPTVISAGTLQLGDGVSNASIASSSITNNATLAVFAATNTGVVVAGNIAGTGAFAEGAGGGAGYSGTVYLTGTNTFSGNVAINAGALWINNSQSLGTGTKNVNIANGTAGNPSLHLNGTNGNIALPTTISLTTSAVNGALFNEAGSNTVAGIITLTSGGGATYIVANAGQLTLAGNISANVAGRQLQLGGAANGVVSGVISDGTGPFPVVKQDAGTWTLTGTNTYTSTTTVSGGTLVVGATGVVPTNLVSVATNATLSGSGLILGAVVITNGANLAPGTAANLGTLTVSNVLTLAANSTNTFRLNASLGTNDAVVGLTKVNYGGTLIVTNVNGTLAAGQSYKLFAAGIYSGTFAGVQLPALPVPLVWSNSLAANGSVQIVSTNAASANAYLTAIKLNPILGALSPAFATNVFSYFATNNYGSTPTVTATNADLTATARLIYNGSTNVLVSGVPSSPLTLNYSPAVTNVIKVQVTAQDGLTVKTYQVNLVQLPNLTNAVLTNSFNGTALNLNWSLDHLGYRLQVQTNSLDTGLGNNWVDWPNSTSLTGAVITNNPANGSVFFRLVYP